MWFLISKVGAWLQIPRKSVHPNGGSLDPDDPPFNVKTP